jgi:hypothetical protein
MRDFVTLHACFPRDGVNAQYDSPRLTIGVATPMQPLAVAPEGMDALP